MYVEAVFGFIENDRLRPVYDLVGHFVAAMRRQAMHEEGVRLGPAHESGVDAIGFQDLAPFRSVAVAHRNPGVSDDEVRTIDRLIGVLDTDGKVRLKQSMNLVSTGAASGGLSGVLWGSLVGLLFLNPLAGMVVGGAVGAGSGALAGSIVDYGIDDNLIREIAQTIKPNSSALFLLVRKAQPDKVLAELGEVHGKIIRSSLSSDAELKLQQAISGMHAASAAAPAGASL